MIRLIKRYGGASRKLYDTEESRYASLEELSAWIRAGQELQILDSVAGEDVTAQTLTQIIYEDHRRGSSMLSGDLLHQVIRRGSQALSEGVEQVQAGVDRMVRSSLDRLAQIGGAKEEMALLHQRLAGKRKWRCSTNDLRNSRPAWRNWKFRPRPGKSRAVPVRPASKPVSPNQPSRPHSRLKGERTWRPRRKPRKPKG